MAVVDNSTAFNGESSFMKCPDTQTQKLIIISVLVLFFCLGAPVNLHVFQLLRRESRYLRRLPISFQYLQRQLNIADLIVLFVYVPSEICHRATGNWRGGALLCKGMRFSHAMSFHLSSNIIVAIALDRLLTPETRNNKCITNIKIAIAWMLAILFSAPQFYFWDLKRDPLTLVTTCTSKMLMHEFRNDTVLFHLQAAYSIFHMATMFWIPASIIVICKALLLYRMWRAAHTFKHAIIEVPAPSLPQDTTGVETLQEHADAMLIVENENRRESRQSARSGSCPAPAASVASQRRVVRLAFTLVFTYVLCWTPYNVIALLVTSMPQFCVAAFSYQLIAFNSCVNPFLYGIRFSRRRCCATKASRRARDKQKY